MDTFTLNTRLRKLTAQGWKFVESSNAAQGYAVYSAYLRGELIYGRFESLDTVVVKATNHR